MSDVENGRDRDGESLEVADKGDVVEEEGGGQRPLPEGTQQVRIISL